MPDLVDRARLVVDALERNDVDAVAAARSQRIAAWEPGLWMREPWAPKMQSTAGPNRRVVAGWRVHDQMARLRVEGDIGQAFVTVLLDSDGLFGLDIMQQLRDGGFGISIACTKEQCDSLRAFWEQLVDAPLGFGEGTGRVPRWPDPMYPQQMHLDVLVPDLETAEAKVLAHGASKRRDSGAFRVYTDPVGHPFCLYPDPSGQVKPSDRLGVLARVVIDCPNPSVLATFWSSLLDMPDRIEDTADRIVVARSDRRLPMIGLQLVHDYHPPRWPDPEYPAQMHFDISYDDRDARERLALKLGATTRLPAQGGSCPVYSDPAGHPFCLCMTGE